VSDVLLCEKRVYVACDTAKEARRVHKMLTEIYEGIQVKLVTGDTKDADDLAFLSDVDRYSLDYDVVVTSPKIKSGISIEHQAAIGQRFDYVVGIFLGTTITSSDAYQMLGRVRYAKTLHVFTDTSRKAHDIDSDDDTTARDALSVIAGSQDRSTRLTRHMADIRNAHAKNISNFAANLYYTLKHYRHEMLRSEYQASVHQETLYKRVKDELNSDDMQRMLAARWLTDDEADAMRREPCLTEDQVWQLKAHDKRKYLNLPTDAQLTDTMLTVNMAQLNRFATVMQLPLDDLDDSDKDLSERRFSTAMRRIVAELSDTLRIAPNAIYAEAQANTALDVIEPHRVKLGVAGFIPSRFATRYYKRGKSSVKDLNEILDHWGFEKMRTRNPTTGKFYTRGEVSILHHDDLRNVTDEKVCRLIPACFDAMHSMYEMHLSPERDFSLIQRCIENDQFWDTSGVFSKKLTAMCPKNDQKTINSMVLMDTKHVTQHELPQSLADQALIEGIIGHTFDKIRKRVKQLPNYAGLSSDQALVAGVADMLQWKAEHDYSLTERTYSVLDSEILLYADDEGAILYKIISAIGSHSPGDVFTIFDSLPPITKSLDFNRDSTKPANTDLDLPDAI
jgi:putative DNA primase/helicase